MRVSNGGKGRERGGGVGGRERGPYPHLSVLVIMATALCCVAGELEALAVTLERVVVLWYLCSVKGPELPVKLHVGALLMGLTRLWKWVCLRAAQMVQGLELYCHCT